LEEMEEKVPASSVFLLGVGECGGNLLGEYINAERERGRMTRVSGYLLLNTNQMDVIKARERYHIPPENTLIFGDTPMGVGGRFMEAYSLVDTWWDTIADQISSLGGDVANTFIILTSTGGGTGCGATPALIRQIKETFGKTRRVYVYVAAVLPFEGQSSEALNTTWLLYKLMQEPTSSKEIADLVILLSNRTMLRRRLQHDRRLVMDIIGASLGVDTSDYQQIEKVLKYTGEVSSKALEKTFIDIVNPLIVQTLIKMLELSTYAPDKNIFPTIDFADLANRLDIITVPALFTDIPYEALKDERGNVDMDSLSAFLEEVVNVTVRAYSLVDIGDEPSASSAFYILSGPQQFTDVHLDIPIKRALGSYLAEGASITPVFVQYKQRNMPMDLLILLGLPKLEEIREIMREAYQLISLHSGSKVKERWFLKSKGVSREVFIDALRELMELFDVEESEIELSGT